jgi:hypothetical protein
MMRYHPRTFDEIKAILLANPPKPGECRVILSEMEGDTLLRYGLRHNVFELAHHVSQELFDDPHKGIRMDVVANNPTTRSILAALAQDDETILAHSGTRPPGEYRRKLFLALCDLWD